LKIFKIGQQKPQISQKKWLKFFWFTVYKQLVPQGLIRFDNRLTSSTPSYTDTDSFALEKLKFNAYQRNKSNTLNIPGRT